MNAPDLNLPLETQKAHAVACEQKLKIYIDPVNGAEVFTQFYLLDRGFCCNQGCRHCPYWDAQIKITFKNPG